MDRCPLCKSILIENTDGSIWCEQCLRTWTEEDIEYLEEEWRNA